MPSSFLPLLLAAVLRAEVVPPQVAGGFYPGDASELGAAVDSFLAAASSGAVKGEILGLLSPHAGYSYSGATAGQAYAQVKGHSYETVIILSAGHRVALRGAATLFGGALETPLGRVPIDAAVAARLRSLSPGIEVLPRAFEGEHSVEVQLPFLQRALQPGWKAVPLLMNTEDLEASRRVGEAVAKVFKAGRTLLVVSSDLSHYPESGAARVADLAVLSALTSRPDDPAYFQLAGRALMRRGVPGLDTTACGESGILAALYAMRRIGGVARLLRYTNSGEGPGGDRSRSVGYAAAAWVRGAATPRTRSLSAESRKNLLGLARRALTMKVAQGKDPESAFWREPEWNLPEAVFVTLTSRESSAPGPSGLPDRPAGPGDLRKAAPGRLRGCVGSLAPNMALADAVQYFAVEAALRDHRFPPVEASELPGLRIEISRLSPFRRVKSGAEVKPGQGVVVRQGERRGLFLPQVWAQLPDKAAFLGEVCEQKAGLPRDCWKDPKTDIEVFDDEAFEESE
ncbi:MAG: AmmeMemoRadiSam system protein B [Elusimicrobia bacterium]|nr:AmmeMemoRadiSam system protein B [Elusimicrobiota bacterium]